MDFVDGLITSVQQSGLSIPMTYSLAQNYPNPFNPSTKINYELPVSNFVSLKIYDMLGREVLTLVNKKQDAGRYVVEFNAGNHARGAYF